MAPLLQSTASRRSTRGYPLAGHRRSRRGRARTPGDEHRVQVALTDTGTTLLADHRTRLRERQLRAFRELTPDQRAVVTELTRRLSELVDEM